MITVFTKCVNMDECGGDVILLLDLNQHMNETRDLKYKSIQNIMIYRTKGKSNFLKES